MWAFFFLLCDRVRHLDVYHLTRRKTPGNTPCNYTQSDICFILQRINKSPPERRASSVRYALLLRRSKVAKRLGGGIERLAVGGNVVGDGFAVAAGGFELLEVAFEDSQLVAHFACVDAVERASEIGILQCFGDFVGIGFFGLFGVAY